MISAMTSMKKLLPTLLSLAMLAGWTALFVHDAGAQAPASLTATAEAPKIDTGDTAWVLTSTALVLLMTAPGLALFYGGMSRSKNALGTVMQSFIVLALISIQWLLWGYSLAFGPDIGGIIGGFDTAWGLSSKALVLAITA